MSRARQSSTVPSLTAREWDVFRLILSGETDKEIASDLAVSPRTASHHVGSILRKLDVETRAGARRWAAGNGDTATDGMPPAPPSARGERGTRPV